MTCMAWQLPVAIAAAMTTYDNAAISELITHRQTPLPLESLCVLQLNLLEHARIRARTHARTQVLLRNVAQELRKSSGCLSLD